MDRCARRNNQLNRLISFRIKVGSRRCRGRFFGDRNYFYIFFLGIAKKTKFCRSLTEESTELFPIIRTDTALSAFPPADSICISSYLTRYFALRPTTKFAFIAQATIWRLGVRRVHFNSALYRQEHTHKDAY